MHGERGASLILALGFLALFALLIPAILNLSATSLLGTEKLQRQRADVYTSDGATDAAIQYLRRNAGCGRIFGACPSNSVTFTSNNGVVSTATITPLITDPFVRDRRVRIDTAVAGVARVTATVYIQDSSTAAEQPVSVEDWTYKR